MKTSLKDIFKNRSWLLNFKDLAGNKKWKISHRAEKKIALFFYQCLRRTVRKNHNFSLWEQTFCFDSSLESYAIAITFVKLNKIKKISPILSSHLKCMFLSRHLRTVAFVIIFSSQLLWLKIMRQYWDCGCAYRHLFFADLIQMNYSSCLCRYSKLCYYRTKTKDASTGS